MKYRVMVGGEAVSKPLAYMQASDLMMEYVAPAVIAEALGGQPSPAICLEPVHEGC